MNRKKKKRQINKCFTDNISWTIFAAPVFSPNNRGLIKLILKDAYKSSLSVIALQRVNTLNCLAHC